MANPNIVWDEWSQPSIEPFMEAVIHFTSGNITLTDDDIYNVSETVELFDSSHVLFGPPSPATATLEIVDFAQQYNPTLNTELTAGTQVDFYLCMFPTEDVPFGPNIVTSYDVPISVSYMDIDVYATLVHINATYLKPKSKYFLEFGYTYTGSTQDVAESFVVPGTWFESHTYALIREQEYTVNYVIIRECEYDRQPYGQFYTQEWSYDSNTHTARVELVDAMHEELTLDNRADGPKPGRSTNLRTFFKSLIDLYQEPYYFSTYFNFTVPYSFYYATQASTLGNCLVALGASYCFMPDGSSAVCDHTGIYDTGITLTDDDVEVYDIQQTSALTYDYTLVYAYLPSLENKAVVTYENFSTVPGTVIPLNVDGLFDVLYVLTEQTNNVLYSTYTWNITGLYWSLTADYSLFEIYGSVLRTSEVECSHIGGSSPYMLKDCKYIQDQDTAVQIASYVDSFYALQYNTIGVSLRGCPSIWVGARMHIYSALYNVDADYVVIKVDFTYDGAVHTNLILQRTF